MSQFQNWPVGWRYLAEVAGPWDMGQFVTWCACLLLIGLVWRLMPLNYVWLSVNLYRCWVLCQF